MSEKKILPKETISEEKLSNVSGGSFAFSNYDIHRCPYCGKEMQISNTDYCRHIYDCQEKYENPTPIPVPDNDPKPYKPG